MMKRFYENRTDMRKQEIWRCEKCGPSVEDMCTDLVFFLNVTGDDTVAQHFESC